MLVGVWTGNIMTFCALKNYRRESINIRTSRGPSSSPSSGNERSISIILALMVASFTLAILPTFATIIFEIVYARETNLFNIKYFNKKISFIYKIISFLSGLTIYINSFFNGLIYFVRDKTFR